MTCVQLGLSCIEEIFSIGGDLNLLITLEDDMAVSKSGRIYLDSIANDRKIPLLKVADINDSIAIEAVKQCNLDWLFIVGWSQIAGPQVLEAPRSGVIGIHPTLLPSGRGRAAIPWAIIKDLKETGVTMFVLDEGVDTGSIVDQIAIPIRERETAETLYGRVAIAHRSLIRKAWPSLSEGTVKLQVQDSTLASEWPARRPSDGEIFSFMRVSEVDRLVRAVTKPYPGAFWRSPSGGTYRIWAGGPSPSPESHLEIPLSDGLYYASVVEKFK